MAHFIRLTSPSGVELRVNMDRIVSYFPDDLPEEIHPRRMGTRLFQGPGQSILVRETAGEVDRLANPTRTP